MLTDIHITTTQVWACTGILAGLDVILAVWANRQVQRERLWQMRWMLVMAAGIFFLLVWSSVLLWGWDWFYSYIFPPAARYWLPLIFGVGYGLLAMGMVWLSLRLPGNPAVIWCILGGVEGLLSHLYAIYGLGAASKPPIMQGTDPLVVLIFAIFEKAFYWSMILVVCNLLWRYLNRKKIKAQKTIAADMS